jgi:hypothetical protein
MVHQHVGKQQYMQWLARRNALSNTAMNSLVHVATTDHLFGYYVRKIHNITPAFGPNANSML